MPLSNVERRKERAAAARAMIQPCLCSHIRRRHAYKAAGFGGKPNPRPCQLCHCSNFVLLQGSFGL